MFVLPSIKVTSLIMILYIDPGTGSMLFTILLGLISAVFFALKSWIIKIKFKLSSKGDTDSKTDGSLSEKYDYVIFSDSSRYWTVFKPICDEFENRKIDVHYFTIDPDDIALNQDYEHIHVKFIGKGNVGLLKMNILNADIVLSTTPGLDVYQWKRSKGVRYYVHIAHAATDLTLYHMFGIDYYDAVLISGDFQREQVKKLEAIRDIKDKELALVGLPYFDYMKKRIETDCEKKTSDKTTVLVAPSWGESGIFKRFGEELLDALTKTEYNIIIRPHPQSLISEEKMIEHLKYRFPDGSKVKWDFAPDNYCSLKNSDIIISDFSGVIYDYALVYNKPVIYADTSFDKSPYDAYWLDEEIWSLKVLPKLGRELLREDICNIRNVIEESLSSDSFKAGRESVRKEAWAYPGEGAVRVVDYLIGKKKENDSI